MAFYRFTGNDLFVNQIETNPSHRFDIYNSQIFYNNRSEQAGAFNSSVPGVPTGHISLYEMNVDRTSADTGLIYSFITRDSSLTAFKTVSTSDFYALDYGDTISGSAYPLSASITREFFDNNHSQSLSDANYAFYYAERDPQVHPTLKEHLDYIKENIEGSHISALRNTIERHATMSPHFQYSASFSDGYSRDLDVVPVNLISIPGIFYGSSLEKGTVNLKYFLTGTLIGELRDINQNGELIQVGPEGSTGSGSVAGMVLYKQGFVILTGSWDLQTTGPSSDAQLDYKNTGTAVTSSWLYFGVGANDDIPNDGEGATTRASASYGFYFSGSHEVPVVTMFAHAPKGQLNFSNNPTYLSYSSDSGYYDALTSSVSYREPDLPTANIVSSSFITPTASFAKETYISKIGIYDKEKNLIAVTTVAKPVKKTEDREFSFKIKLDI